MFQLTMARSEAETRQRYANQIMQLEKEIAQQKKRVEQEVAQRHTVERNQDVSCTPDFSVFKIQIWYNRNQSNKIQMEGVRLKRSEWWVWSTTMWYLEVLQNLRA